MSELRRDLVSAASLAAVGTGAHVVARGIEARFKTGVDSGFFPELVSAALVLSAAIIAGSALRRRQQVEADTPSGSTWRVWGAFAAVVAYVAALPIAGFLASTAAFLFVQISVLAPAERRRPLAFALVALVAAGMIHAIFRVGFGLPLPRGPF